MIPDVGISRPASVMSKVLLPQPLGPMITRNSPCYTRRLTVSRATTSRGVSAPHTLVTSVQTSTPMGILHSSITGVLSPCEGFAQKVGFVAHLLLVSCSKPINVDLNFE